MISLLIYTIQERLYENSTVCVCLGYLGARYYARKFLVQGDARLLLSLKLGRRTNYKMRSSRWCIVLREEYDLSNHTVICKSV